MKDAGANLGQTTESLGHGIGVVESPDLHLELDAFDSLPPEVRAVISESPYSLSALDTLSVLLQGAPRSWITDRIHEANLELAKRVGTIPGEDYTHRPLALKPAPTARRTRR